MTPKSVSLYIHLPWCVKKCPYCDFNAHPLQDNVSKPSYIKHLVEDLHSHHSLLAKRTISSVFIGGGTPSLFTADELKPLFEAINTYTLDRPCEVTMEVNPGASDHQQFAGYLALGVNRLSIGGQSFDNGLLTTLGRVHAAQDTHQAIRHAKAIGFKRINLDIMYGTPGQTLMQALSDLDLFLAYDLEHLSWYHLNIEANTKFAVFKPDLPPEHLVESIETHGKQLLEKHGYRQYEISAWTKDKGSYHNLNYWHFGDYLGIGCGAHSKLHNPDTNSSRRIIKQKHPKAYMQPDKIQADILIDPKEILLEFAINFFRTTDRMSYTQFTALTGISAESLKQSLSKAEALGLITFSEDTFGATYKGQRHYHEICLTLS